MTLAADAGGKTVEAREATDEPATKAPPKRRLVLFAVLGAAIVGGGGYWLSQRGLESTDDAQVDADLVGVAPRTNGVVTKVLFEDNQVVKTGQVLVELDPTPAKAKLAQAEATLDGARAAATAAQADADLAATTAKTGNRAATASLSAASAGVASSKDQITEARARVTAAESSLAQAKLELDRTQRLVSGGALGQAALDQAKTAADTADASLAQARAHLSVLEAGAAQASKVAVVIAQAEARAQAAKAKVAELEAARDLAKIELSYTTILAPQDGVVSKKNVAVGQTVAMGAPLVSLLPAKAMWITANFKETQVGKMHAGQPVTIEVDAFPGTKIHGTLESFSAATGAKFALLPPDNATGNFTKVVQRLPVRVKLDDVPSSIALRPGMSADVTVDTRK